MKHTVQPPRLLLSGRSLAGVSLATRDRTLEVHARFREPESLAVTLSKAMDAGVDGVLTSPTAALRAALAELRRAVSLYLVLPALTEYERQELEPGIEPLLARDRNIGVGTLMRISVGRMLHPAFRFRGDLVARTPIMIEAEVAAMRPRDLRGVVVDTWLTDLALAAGHKRFFESTCRFIQRRYRAAAGFETHNLGLLLARLREWDVHPDFVVGPLNPVGMMMKPSPEDVVAEVERAEIPVVAKEIRAGGVVTLEEGARFARDHHAYGLAPDLAELDDVGLELRALQGAAAPPRAVELRAVHP